MEMSRALAAMNRTKKKTWLTECKIECTLKARSRVWGQQVLH